MDARHRTATRAAARDTALRRLSWLRGGLAAGAVLLLLVLANASAHAFSGHRTTSSRSRAGSPRRQIVTPSGVRARRRADQATSAPGASVPVSPPTTVPKSIAAPGSSARSATAAAPTTTAPAATVPAAPAPVQVVSGGS